MNVRDMIPWRGKEARLARLDDPLASLQRRMNSLFEDFFEPGLRAGGAFVPSVDVADKEKEVVVTAELPGMEEKDIEVTVDEGVLSICGEKCEESKKERKGYYQVERSFGSFYRTIPLPAAVDRDQVKAVFKKGVLEITLPKTAEAQKKGKKIKVETAA